MRSARSKIVLVLTLTAAPTPALASDFSVVGYYLLAGYYVVAIILAVVGWFLIGFVKSDRRRAACRAVLMALLFSPSTAKYFFVPAAVTAAFGFAAFSYEPESNPIFVILVNLVIIGLVAMALYWLQMRKYKTRADKNDAG